MIAELTILQEIIEEVVDVDVAITAGRPAAPSGDGEDCTTIVYVFGDNLTDFNENDATSCVVRSRLAMQYEIWTCYPEDWEDQVTTTDGLDAATRLYGMMAAVWCALVDAKDTAAFGRCEWVELGSLEVQPRLGGAVSALGSVTVQYDCPVETSPSSP